VVQQGQLLGRMPFIRSIRPRSPPSSTPSIWPCTRSVFSAWAAMARLRKRPTSSASRRSFCDCITRCARASRSSEETR